MTIGILPYLLVLASSLVPVICSLLDLPPTHFPAGMLLLTMPVLLFSSGAVTAVLRKQRLTWALWSMGVCLAIQVATGRGFGILAAGGYVLIFAFAFYAMLLAECSIQGVVRGVSTLYKFFMLGLLIEAVVILAGGQPVLGEWLSSTRAPGYKLYNQADFLKFFGMFEGGGGGLNSVLLGSQIAGMLSLFSTYWLIGIRRHPQTRALVPNSGLWLLISMVLLLFTANFTVLVVGIAIVVGDNLTSTRPHRAKILTVVGLVSVLLYVAISQRWIWQRIFSDEAMTLSARQIQTYSDFGVINQVTGLSFFDYYVFQFLTPVTFWQSLDWIRKLIGVGVAFFLDGNEYVSGDFGFATDVLLKTGLVWAVILVVAVVLICLPARRHRRPASPEDEIWASLRAINAVIAIGLLLSTIHYNQALANPGCIPLFGLHLALAAYCDSRRERATAVVEYRTPRRATFALGVPSRGASLPHTGLRAGVLQASGSRGQQPRARRG